MARSYRSGVQRLKMPSRSCNPESPVQGTACGVPFSLHTPTHQPTHNLYPPTATLSQTHVHDSFDAGFGCQAPGHPCQGNHNGSHCRVKLSNLFSSLRPKSRCQCWWAQTCATYLLNGGARHEPYCTAQPRETHTQTDLPRCKFDDRAPLP